MLFEARKYAKAEMLPLDCSNVSTMQRVQRFACARDC